MPNFRVIQHLIAGDLLHVKTKLKILFFFFWHLVCKIYQRPNLRFDLLDAKDIKEYFGFSLAIGDSYYVYKDYYDKQFCFHLVVRAANCGFMFCINLTSHILRTENK